MILSDHDIQEYITSGDISIEPFDSNNLKPGSYTFTLGSKLYLPQADNVIDARNPSMVYKEIEIGPSGYVLAPGDFILGQTQERLSVSQRVACLLDARTTLTRVGLNVLQSSTFVEPGQSKSNETLEISNIGPSPITIFAGMKIVKAIFMLLVTRSDKNYSDFGTYRQQSSPSRRG